MESKSKGAIEAMLDARIQRNRVADEQAVMREQKRMENVDAFETLVRDVIKPAFGEISTIYEAKGFPAKVREEAAPRRLVELDLSTPTDFGKAIRPGFSLCLLESPLRQVLLLNATPGSSGPVGSFKMELITKDWIFEKFAEHQKA